MLCCTMTTKIQGYPFEVIVPGERESAVLADQVKSLDWKERNAAKKGKISAAVLTDVRTKAKALTS